MSRGCIPIAQLFRKFNLDRVIYLRAYTALFDTDFRNRINNVLEIGIGSMISGAPSNMADYSWPTKEGYRIGNGLCMWQELLPQAQVYGLDIQPDTQISEARIRTYFCDSTKPLDVQRFFDSIGNPPMDVIIDDGSHKHEDQLKTLENFYPHLAVGGVYIIEDIGVRIEESYLPTAQKICVNAVLTLELFDCGSILVIKK